MARIPYEARWVRWVGWFAAVAGVVLLTSSALGAVPGRAAQTLPDDPPQTLNFCEVNQPAIAATLEAVPSALAVITVREGIGEGRMMFEVRNYAPEEIRQVIFDSFTADANPVHFGWAVREAQTLLRPMNGNATVQYPDSSTRGNGPAVISFEGLTNSKCAVFSSYLECWDHAGECPMLADLGGSRLEVVFAHSLRGTGVLTTCPKHGFLWSRSLSRAHRIPCDPGTSVAVIRNER